MKVTAAGGITDDLLQRFWLVEEVPGDAQDLETEERQAVEHFLDTTYRGEDGRYVVQLPRKKSPPVLGESRSLALKRYTQNEKSLRAKNRWEEFSQAVREYGQLHHAELVPPEELHTAPPAVFYLPMHGVVKDSSTTTKLRVAFDASAKSRSGFSLNDTLLPGPSLYPLLPSILNRFWLPLIRMSADISKMFREVGLQEVERDYHRFLHRDQTGSLQDWRMTRLTFGVTSSPYLATQVLRQVASDH